MSYLETLFNKFHEKIVPTTNQIENLKKSHSFLRNQILNNLYFVENTILTGSYKRKTLIRPLNDVDIFVILNYADTYEAPLPQTILNSLKKELKLNYPNSIIKQDRPCVTAHFNHCSFELTPAIKLEKTSWFSGNTYFEYLIPNSNLKDWVKVDDPNILGQKLAEKNKSLNNKLIPLIRMMKRWKVFNDIRDIKSYEMEEIAIKSIDSITTYRKAVEKLLYEYKFIGWWRSWDIENMSDEEFADYCYEEVFGNEFPLFI
jgi:hypothetical protein